jgi:hypothetical protein
MTFSQPPSVHQASQTSEPSLSQQASAALVSARVATRPTVSPSAVTTLQHVKMLLNTWAEEIFRLASESCLTITEETYCLVIVGWPGNKNVFEVGVISKDAALEAWTLVRAYHAEQNRMREPASYWYDSERKMWLCLST